MTPTSSPPSAEAAIWHDVECGAYAADLPLWRELSARAAGPVLELGAGTGRVALALAQEGHRVAAVEREPGLAAALSERSDGAVEVVVADLRELALAERFALVIAPMQLMQVVGDPSDRDRALAVIAAHLHPGGVAAAAIVEHAAEGEVAGGELLPDVREVEGFLYSSLPLSLRVCDSWLEATRLRQRVSPSGELAEATHVERLHRLSAADLDGEASRAGLVSCGRMAIPGDEAFVGATVCLWERR